jgi:hypothetical protein
MPAHARVLPRNSDVDLRQITTFGSRLMSGATRALAGRAPWYVGLTTVGTVLKRLSAASPRRTGDGGSTARDTHAYQWSKDFLAPRGLHALGINGACHNRLIIATATSVL